MYLGSLQIIFAYRLHVLVLILMIFSIEVTNETYLYDDLSISIIFVPMMSYLAFKVTEYILRPELDKYAINQALFSGFFWRFFGLTFPLLIAYFIVYPVVPSFAPDFLSGLNQYVQVVILAIISHFILCLLFLIQFSFFGLKLPEALVGQISVTKNKLSQKPKHFWAVFSRLLIGPVFISSIGVVINYSAHAIHPALRDLLLDAWIPNIFGITLFLFCLFMQVWAVVMTFWVLAYAYIRIEYGDKGMQVVYRY